MHPGGYRKSWLLLAFAVFALVWFSTLQYRKLIKPDEGRYAEIPREMVATGDWLTPRLNGIKYFEKPPLQYWATATAFELFGADQWTARLWPALTGFAGVLLAFFTGRRLFGATAGALAAMVLGTSLWYLIIGHLNTLDMGVTFFLQAALCAFLFAQLTAPRSRGERRWMLAAWAAMAFAVLSKGLEGLALPGMTLLVYCALQRDFSALRRMHWGAGLALFLLIVAPWFVAVSIANPEFPRFFFIHEHFERFLTKEHGRYQPAWYFIPIFAVGMLPWTTMALHGAVSAWRASMPAAFNARRFLGVWSGAIFIFFSLSSSKLPSYILPIFPALALLAGDWLARKPVRALRWHIAVLLAVALIAIGLLPRLARFAEGGTPDAEIVRYSHWLMVAAGVFAAGTLCALWENHRGRALAALVVLSAAALFSGETILQGHEALGRSNSAYYIAQQIRPLLVPGAPFYSVGMYEQTLPFYLQRTVTLVDYQDELAFGLQQEPQLAVPTLAEFRARWQREPGAFAVFTREGYESMLKQGLPMQVIAQDTRRVIVRRP